ncbi:hypothetical protein [Streptomyces spiralis]|uniref:hypothetical protein n=1 Tax=Streptomyces spiralis TaxID=66376 RepID=UPI0036AEF527
MPRTFPCYTCGTDQPHRQPQDDRERDFIRKLAKKRKPNAYVEDYWICVSTAQDCRNIRTGLRVKPFDPPVRMPVWK